MTFYNLNNQIRKDIEKYYGISNLDVNIKSFKTREVQELFARARGLYLYILYDYGLVHEADELTLYVKSVDISNIRLNISKIRRFRKKNPLKFAEIIEEIPSLYTLESYRILLKYCKVPINKRRYKTKYENNTIHRRSF
jgi:hypothetical protein